MPAGQRDDQPPPVAIAVAPETVPRAVPFALHGTNDPVTPTVTDRNSRAQNWAI